jgi:hypothetical protein
LLAQGRWFSPGTPASSTTKNGRHDIAEILLKVALNTKIQIPIARRLIVLLKLTDLSKISSNLISLSCGNETATRLINNFVIHLGFCFSG